MVDQNIHQALDLCDRGYILRTGEIAATGSPEELRRSREVQAAYLGVA